MQWWNDLVNWLSSDTGWRIVTDALIPFVAILVAGLVAALIARNAVRRVLAKHDREQKAAAIGALVNAARQASVWDSLSPQEQILSDRAAGDADILVRLLPIRGASVAADWAAHEILEFKRGSATFGFQFDTLLGEFRDRLIDWQRHPGRVRKIFQTDIARWEIELTDTEKQLQSQQDAWVSEQHSERFPPKVLGNTDASAGTGADTRTGIGSVARPTPASGVGIARPVSAAWPLGGAGENTGSIPNGATGAHDGSQRHSSALPHASASPRQVEAPDEEFTPYR